MPSTPLLILSVLLVLFYTVIIEVFTVLFRMTGITWEKARTQVISLLTGCGFTTGESEVILSTRRRRKIAQTVMLLGNLLSVLVVSMLVNLFLELKQSEVKSLVFPVTLVLLFTAFSFLLMRLRPVRARFDQFVEQVGNRLMYGKNRNIISLVDMYHKKAMVEATLKVVPPGLRDTALSQSRLKEDYDIQILSILRGGRTLESVGGETRLIENDVLVLFGDYKSIRVVFGLPAEE